MNIKTYIAGLLGALALALFSASASAAFPASGCGTCHAVPTADGAPDTCSATFDPAKQQIMSANAALLGVTLSAEQIAAEITAQCGIVIYPSSTTTTTTAVASTTTTTFFDSSSGVFPAYGCGGCHAVPTSTASGPFPNPNTCSTTFDPAKQSRMASFTGFAITPDQIAEVVRAQCGIVTYPTTTTTASTTTTTFDARSGVFPTIGCGACHAVPTNTALGPFPEPNTCSTSFNPAKQTTMAINASIFGITITPDQIAEVVRAQCGIVTYPTTTTAASTTTTTFDASSGVFPPDGCAVCHAVPTNTASGPFPEPNTCSTTFDPLKQLVMAISASIFNFTITPDQIAEVVRAQCGVVTYPTTTTTESATTTTFDASSGVFPAYACGGCHAVPTSTASGIFPEPNTCSTTFDPAKQRVMAANALVFGFTISPDQIAEVVRAQCGTGTYPSTTTTTMTASTTTTTLDASSGVFPAIGCGNCHAVPTAGGIVNTCSATFDTAKRQAMVFNASIFGVTFTKAQIDAVVAAQCSVGGTTTTTPSTTTTTTTTPSTMPGDTSFPANGCGNCHAVPTPGGSVSTCSATFSFAKRQIMASNAGLYGVTFTMAQIDAVIAAQCGGGTTTTTMGTASTTMATTTSTATATTTTVPSAGGGEALYNSMCAGCHSGTATGGGGRNVYGARVCSIKGALNGTKVFPTGVPQMAFLKSVLNDTQIQAISDYLNSGSVTGQQRYITACAGCHGVDARGGRVGESVRGENAAEISEAIYDESAMRFLNCLPEGDVGAIGGYLSGSAYSTTTRYATTTTRRSTTTTGSVTTTTKRCSRYDRRCHGKPHRDRDDD